ncbi:MAG: hypothetical protein ACO1OC_07240 [Tuberibacillus sp.]
MVRITVKTLTVPLILIHIAVVYLWVVEWEKLVTPMGLTVWLGSTCLGILFSFFYYWRRIFDKGARLLRKTLFVSTATSIGLIILSCLIEAAVQSMP